MRRGAGGLPLPRGDLHDLLHRGGPQHGRQMPGKLEVVVFLDVVVAVVVVNY